MATKFHVKATKVKDNQGGGPFEIYLYKEDTLIRHFLSDPYHRQGPRFTIRMVIGIFCSDTETGAVTPPGVMQKK